MKKDNPEAHLHHPGLLAFTATFGGAVIGFANAYDYFASPNSYSATVTIGSLVIMGIGGYALSSPAHDQDCEENRQSQ